MTERQTSERPESDEPLDDQQDSLLDLDDQQDSSLELEDDGPEFDEAQIQFAVDQLRSEQNLPLGVIAGFLAALIGAGIWAALVVSTHRKIGLMAIGIGFLVGVGIRTFGKGIDKTFGYAGAVLALLGCLLGNVLAWCGLWAAQNGVSFLDVVADVALSPTAVVNALVTMFSPMDLLFYGIALYEGYKLSFRQLSEDEIISRMTGSKPSELG